MGAFINTARLVMQNGQKLLYGKQTIWASDLSDRKILDNIRMRSIFARYLRNIDQMFPLIQRKEFGSDRSGH